MKTTPQNFASERIKKLIELTRKTHDTTLKKFYLQLAKKICSRHKLNMHSFGLDKKKDNTVEKKVRISKGKRIVIWLSKE